MKDSSQITDKTNMRVWASLDLLRESIDLWRNPRWEQIHDNQNHVISRIRLYTLRSDVQWHMNVNTHEFISPGRNQ
jgi:hypothetical protein